MSKDAIGQFKVSKRDNGWFAISDRVLIAFGNAKSSPEGFQKDFPSLQFHYITQAHTNRVLNLDAIVNKETQADGHMATKPKQALAIKTADCMPIFLCAKQGGLVVALHAGWRGLESEIIGNAISKLVSAGFFPSDLMAFIGPHIAAKNFEVDSDVATKLAGAYRKVRFDQTATILLPHEQTGKAYADLLKLALGQLKISGIPEKNTHVLSEDTFSNPNFHSYRRDKELAGRQISFITLL